MRVATRADGTARLHRAGEVEYAWAHSGAPRAARGPAGGAGEGTEGASCGAPGEGRCHGPSDGATSRSSQDPAPRRGHVVRLHALLSSLLAELVRQAPHI